MVPPAHPRDQRRALLGATLIAAVVVAFYAYMGQDILRPLRFVAANDDYYPLLVDGFRHGSLALAAEPPAALAQLPDPYDPVQREKAGIEVKHDASYYHGHYYLYFGVAPAVTLFWPFRVLTGVHLPQGLATVLFCAGGYLSSLALFLRLRGRYFPDTGGGWVCLGALMLGLCNFCPGMLARNSIWEVPIACAYFYSSLGLLLLFEGYHAIRRRSLWLAAAGTAWGLSIASRPHFLLLCAVLGVWWLRDVRHSVRSESPPPRPRVRWETVALFLPIVLVIAGLMTYNHARFGNPLEFGQRYQVGGEDEMRLQPLGGRFIPPNFYYYFLAPAQFQRYFPFVEVIRSYRGARPAGYAGAEDPFGILPNLPVAWLALAAPLICRRRGRNPPGVGRWLALFGLCFLTLAGILLCFNWATNRYMVDFLPSLLLVTSIGLLALTERNGSSRAAGRVAAGAAIVYSAVFSALAGINHNGQFRGNHPMAFAALSRFFNRPALAWDKAHPQSFGPAEITLQFPADQPGMAEPILVTGVSYRSDYVYAVYPADGRHIQLGFVHSSHNQELTPPIPIDYRVPHTIGLSLGSLYPAENHPFFAGWNPAEIHAVKHTLTVTLDGVPYLSRDQEFFDTSPGFVTFGANLVSDFTAPRFTGRIIATRRGPLPPLTIPFHGAACLRLALVLPASPAERREPLIATGLPGRSDLFFIEYQDTGQVRLGLEQVGRPPEFSRQLTAPAGGIQLLEASLGSFYDHPSNARERELAKTLFVRWNGQVAWVEKCDFFPGGPSLPTIGSRGAARSAVAPSFTGRIVAQGSGQMLPTAPASVFHFASYWIEAGAQPVYGPVRLRIELPAQVISAADPLLVTGPCATQGDYIPILYPRPGQIEFGYNNSGTLKSRSRPFRAEPGDHHTVEIDMPSLYPPESDEYFGTRTIEEIMALKRGWLELRMDGMTVLNTPVPYYDSTAEQIMIGENQLSQVYDPRFTGKILSAERFVFASPPGFDANRGPLELVLSRSKAIIGEETLLASGMEAAPDALVVSYEGPGHCRFSARTANGQTIAGDPVALDDAGQHTLLVQWGGFYAKGEMSHRVAVHLDGRLVLAGRLDFQFATPQPVSIGRATPYAGNFSGRLKSVRRLTDDAP